MNCRNLLRYTIVLLCAICFASCHNSEKKYRIGVSQCSNDIWRDKQNAELRMGAYLNDDVDLLFATADDSDERQVQQIDSLVAEGIDLLIVAPNQVGTISPAIDRAYDKGIPVIVFERKTDSKKYTAYMGADNYEMGRLMGEYVASRLNHRGNIVEVMGLKGSSPAIERHNGFNATLKKYPDIRVVATLQGDWTEPTAYNITRQWLMKNADRQVDLVFGMNDRTAMGARKAFLENLKESPSLGGVRGGIPLFCGIDGLPGEGGGIQLVRDSLLDASYIYPTHGDQLLKLAVDILEGKPYEKETSLMSAIVTHDNARVLQLESDEVMRQSQNVEQLHKMSDGYLQRLANQRMFTLLSVGIILLLLLLFAGLWRYNRQKARIAKERNRLEREQLDFYTQVSHELRTPLTLIEGPLAQLSATDEMQKASAATADMLDIVQRNAAHLSRLVNKIFDAQQGNVAKGLSPHEIDEMIVSQTREAHDRLLNESTVQQGIAKAFGEQPTVLVVDDNADIRSYIHSILQSRYRIIEAADGEQALAVAREEVPDLILSDVMMPVMNGLDFCRQVKADFVTSHIPVILVTARAMNQHQVEGYESGADAYITKPFVADVLLARVDNLLKSRRVLKNLWNQPVEKQGVEVNQSPQPASPEVKEATPQEETPPAAENTFITRFKKVVEERMSDSDLSVETIAAELALSRVQLYRKVKALTGCTPVDLLRKARLSKALELLADPELTVSEIAYRVGFTSPSYFTKCFKDEYGKVPGEVRVTN